MPKKRTIRPSAAYEGLRQHGVLREADLRDLMFERSQGKRPRHLHVAAELRDSTPALAAYLDRKAGFRPRVKTGSASDAASMRRRLETMYHHAGALVLVTAVRHDLAGLPLKDASTVAEWLEGHEFMVGIIAPGAPAFDAVLQAGAITDQLHDHTVLPLSALQPDLQAFVEAAPRGAGGGALHPESGLHFVILGDDDDDRARVASYMSRDADGRFDLPDDHPDYLQAHDDALVRKLTSVKSPKLTRQRLPDAWR